MRRKKTKNRNVNGKSAAVILDECIQISEAKQLIKEKWRMSDVLTVKELGLKSKRDAEIVSSLNKRLSRKKIILFTKDKKFKKFLKPPGRFVVIKLSSRIAQKKKNSELKYIKKFLDTISSVDKIKGEKEFTITPKEIIKKFRSGHTSILPYKF